MIYQLIFDSWLTDNLSLSTFNLKIIKQLDVLSFKKDLPNKPAFVYTRTPIDNLTLLPQLAQNGFHLIDTNIVFAQSKLPKNNLENQKIICNFAKKEEQDEIVNIAKNSFKYSRFHLDPYIDSSLANQIKMEWVKNYFHGKRGDAMIVARLNHQVAGFIQLLNNNQQWIIDLIAVSEKYQRQGVAQTMISYANKQFGLLRVGTQLANTPSIRLYENQEFRFIEANYILHYHHNVE